ncbi:MAG: hypothetical protein U1E77_06670 [Inhella sp.]
MTTVLRSLRSLLVARLEPGTRVEIAESGAEALEILEELDAEAWPAACCCRTSSCPACAAMSCWCRCTGAGRTR